MKVIETGIPDLVAFEPPVFRDHRGEFMEVWNGRRYDLPEFVQDNVSRSRRGVVRGLHFQHPNAQGKLVTAVHGEVFDVAVDIRRGSPTFGRWWGTILSAENGRQLWVPEGFAHGFAALADESIVTYKCSAYYSPDDERTLLWNDPELGIEWPVSDPVLSDKDRAGLRLDAFGDEGLPEFR